MKTFNETFSEKIVVMESGCHLWGGTKDRCGYGRIRRNGIRKMAHRMAWESIHGSIPEGLNVCHHCDEPSCVNVNHLFVGTQKDNIEDMIKKGRKIVNSNPIRGENHWTRKHPENIYRCTGEKNGGSKLSMEEVKQIREEEKQSHHAETYYANKYKVCRSTIGRILRNEGWKNL